MNEVTNWLTQVWRRAVVLPVLLHFARRDLKRGRLARAKARFLRCTQLVPFSFQAHFGLACIYLRERDYSRAQRELMLAKEIAPSRFRACKARLPELVGFIDSGFSDSVENVGNGTNQQVLSNGVSTASAVDDGWPGDWPRDRVGDLGGAWPGDGRSSSEHDIAHQASSEGPPFPGDFTNHDEWMKFRRMGPISTAEVATVDWDHVVSEIFRRDG